MLGKDPKRTFPFFFPWKFLEKPHNSKSLRPILKTFFSLKGVCPRSTFIGFGDDRSQGWGARGQENG